MSERLKDVGAGLGCCAAGVAGVVLVAEALLSGDFERSGRLYTPQTTPLVFWLHMVLASVGAVILLGLGGLALWSRPDRIRLSGPMAARVERQLRPEPRTSHPPEERGGDGRPASRA